MSIERLRERLSNGLRPFKVCLSDGTKIPVPHPEFVAMSKRVVVVVGQNDHVYTIDPRHIVALEESRSKAKAY